MAFDMIRNRAGFYVSLVSICWESSLSLALTWLLQFYSAYIHAFAIHIIKTEVFCFVNAKDPEILPNGRYPSSVSLNNEAGSAFEEENSQQRIKRWELARIFNALDRNRDGMVSEDDIQCLLDKLGIQYLCDYGVKMVTSFSEHMRFDEFCRDCLGILEDVQSAESVHGPPEKEELMEAFCVFDRDGDGFITASELQYVLLRLGLSEARDLQNCEAMITRFDKNSDGRIDFVEFENMSRTILNAPL